jgi:phosphatidylglycerophosphate synthase
MKNTAILYVPSDTPEAMTVATKKVAGVPIILRGVMTLAQAGIDRCILLMAGSQKETIERFLPKFSKQNLPEIEYVLYDEPYRVSPDTVKRITSLVGEKSVLVNADFIFEQELVSILFERPDANSKVIQFAQSTGSLPFYSVPKFVWEELSDFTAQKPRSIESCIHFLAEKNAIVFIKKPVEVNTFLVTRQRDRAVAEKALAETIRHRIDGPVARHINKRLSLPASLIMAKLWISPNAITAMNIIIGVFSGVFVADGHRYAVILLGAILFQIASIVDGCDGEVAKLTFRCTKFGQYADTLCDNLSLGSFITGLIAGYWRHTHSPVAFIVGAVLVLATALIFFWMIRYLKKNTDSASFVTFDKQYLSRLQKQPAWLLTVIKYGKYTLKKDVFSFMFLCFAFFGVLYWWLFIAAFGTVIAALILTYLNLSEMLTARKMGMVSRVKSFSEGGNS